MALRCFKGCRGIKEYLLRRILALPIFNSILMEHFACYGNLMVITI